MFEDCTFYPWVNLTQKQDMNNYSHESGVYMIAQSAVYPGDSEISNKAIIYIGETTSQKLIRRINQFAVSAFNEKAGHSGGNTFRNKYMKVIDGERVHTVPQHHIWISVCPIAPNNSYTSTYIKYLERKLLWDFSLTHGKLPELNKK